MSSADAASPSVASSSSTSGPLSPSSSGTTQVDPPPEQHASHSTPSTHVLSTPHTNTVVDAVLDTSVTDLTSDVGENAFMIIEGESQDGSVDDTGHESVDVQGREGVMVMDNGDDGQQWFPEHENHELKRVKVYELIDSRWVDQGTALCFGQYEDGEAALVAKAEANMSEIILKTTIRSSDVYQRQQDTLIVWTEPDGVDYALSFQDPEGCMELWNFILEVQSLRANSGDQQAESSSSPLTGPEPSITTASIIRTGHLPQPALGIILEIDRAIRTLCRTPVIRDKICQYIQQADYIKAMIDVMHQAEDLENLENLHSLCALVQTILMMSDHSMYDHILDDDRFFGVLGMLEYDPEFPAHKANYRDFLRHSTRYHQPVTIHDPLVQKKIHHTYRLLFLKDVVLARALDDSTFNVLSSCIIFNQIDIITHVQNDVQFLQDIVGLFIRPNLSPSIYLNGTKNKIGNNADTNSDPMSNGVDEDRRCNEVILLIQQLCIMGKNVQLPARMALFKTLVDRGIVHAVQWALSQSEGTEDGQQMIAVAGEVLITLLDHDASGVREHVVKQCEGFETRESRDESLLTLLCGLMVRSRDLAVQTLVGDSLRLMLEMPPPEVNEVPTPAKPFSRTRDDARTEKFLDYFYKLCIHSLLKPIFDVPNHKQHPPDSNLILTREKTNLYLSLCDLLSTFALQHTFRSHFFMLTSGISSHVATLLSSKDKHLRLAALRFFRTHLKNNNRNFLNHLVKLESFKPIIELTIKESYRDTLVGSSCQEFFEFMRRENMKDVIAHVMTIYEDQVKQLSESRFCGQCFRGFIRRYEMNIHPPPEAEEKPLPSQPSEIRRVDLAEESYFNTDDEEDDDAPGPHPAPTSPLPLPPLHSPPLSRIQFAQKRRRQRTPGIPLRTGLGGSGSGGTQRVPAPATPIHLPRTPPINALVDYRDDDEPSSDPEDALLESLVSTNNKSSPPASTSSAVTNTTTTTPTPTPAPAIPTTTTTNTGTSGGGGFVPLRAEKRRRAEEDEDESGLERLVSGKSRRPAKVASAGSGEEGPKRIRLRFGAASLAAAAAATAASTLPTTARSEPRTKDGDTG